MGTFMLRAPKKNVVLPFKLGAFGFPARVHSSPKKVVLPFKLGLFGLPAHVYVVHASCIHA